MFLRGTILMVALALASVRALPPAVQDANAPGAIPAPASDASGGGPGDNRHRSRKALRRCARRSRLGICERWNMPKSAVPREPGPENGSDSRNSATKH